MFFSSIVIYVNDYYKAINCHCELKVVAANAVDVASTYVSFLNFKMLHDKGKKVLEREREINFIV